MNIKLLLFTLFLFQILSATAQKSIVVNGQVKDNLGNVLPFANIVAQEKDSMPIISYGIADENGKYNFEVPSSAQILLKASLLGYQSEIIKIENNSKKVLEVNFNLTPKELILKEAIITGSNKIVQKSDTITFNADRFRDSTERNLEELLAKIPGVDVSKDGVITVQGKPIKKILIEGDDLTGRNYQLMSKNMAADVVDKIQVIDRFTENKLLKGLKRSEDKVINITLKENRKKLLFGNAVAGLGNDERTNNSLNLFGFYKKLKTVTFGNFNTIGQISTADRMMDMDFKEDTEADNLRSVLKSRNTNLIDIGRTPSVSLNSQSVRFNRAALASTHFIFRPAESFRLKGVITFSNDRPRSYVNDNYQYLLGDTLFNLSEKNDIERKPTIVEGHLEAQIDLNTRSSILYRGDIRNSMSNNSTSTIANGNNINSALANNTVAFSNVLDYTYRINDYHAMTANLTLISDNATQDLTLSQTLPRLTPSVFLPSDALFQNVQRPMTYYALSGQWLYAKNTLKVSTYTGAVLKQENLSSQMRGQLGNQPIQLSDTFNNELMMRQSNYYLGLNFKETWRGIDLFSDVSSGFQATNLSGRTSENNFYALPTFGFKKKIKEKHALFATYAYNFQLPQMYDLINGYVLTDYRSLSRGSTAFIPANSHTSIFNYTYGNFSDEFLWHFNVLHSSNLKGYRSDFGIDANFNLSNKLENNFNNQSTLFSGGIERYMPKVYMRLKVRPSVSLGNYPNTLNGSDIRNTKTVNSSVDISLRSAYLKWFNFHFGTTISQSLIKTNLGDVQNEVKNNSIGSFIDFYLKLNSRCSAKLENELFYFKQENTLAQRYYFINASTNYDIIKAKLTASLTAKNLLNTNEFINSFVTDYVTQINRIRLLPRYVLFEVNFRF
jgi:CarboxypepD_reg-like domain